MSIGYTLLDAKYEGDKVTLFYLSDDGEIEQWLDNEDYYPYFYTLDEGSLEGARAQGCKIVSESKRELFSDLKKEFYKISAKEETLSKVKMMFTHVWEDEVQTVEKYAFDKGMRFGMGCQRLGERTRLEDVNTEVFDKTFDELLETDPVKYNFIKRFFEVIEQPLPEISENTASRYGYDMERMLEALYLSRITNSPITFRNAPPSYFIKALYYLNLKSEGYVIPTPEEFSRSESPRGVYGKAALVLKPEKGIFLNTYVLDYESLYPSCIDVYNLSHETVNCGHEQCLDNKVPEEEHHICTIRRGKYSTIIGALKDLRIKYYKKKARNNGRTSKVVSDVLKMILVICYGVTIRIRGLSNPALAESITAYSRHALKTAWKYATEIGLKPLYGDTDSLFLVNPQSKQLQTLIERVKKELKLDLAVDKKYKVCVFSSAKKAYLGIFENGKVDPKGLTAFKSNTPNFVKKVLEETAVELSKINALEDIPIVRRRILQLLKSRERLLLERRFEVEDMAFNVILHKKPSEIIESNVYAQPYQCAIQLIDEGIRLRRKQILTFAKVKAFNYKGKRFSVKPIDRVNKDEINVPDYISNMYSMMNQVLEPLGIGKGAAKNEYDTLTRWFKESDTQS
ncbi:MAG: DNA polymerase domain-containing protein [Nitrososphaeria archaeon]